MQGFMDKCRHQELRNYELFTSQHKKIQMQFLYKRFAYLTRLIKLIAQQYLTAGRQSAE